MSQHMSFDELTNEVAHLSSYGIGGTKLKLYGIGGTRLSNGVLVNYWRTYSGLNGEEVHEERVAFFRDGRCEWNMIAGHEVTNPVTGYDNEGNWYGDSFGHDGKPVRVCIPAR